MKYLVDLKNDHLMQNINMVVKNKGSNSIAIDSRKLRKGDLFRFLGK